MAHSTAPTGQSGPELAAATLVNEQTRLALEQLGQSLTQLRFAQGLRRAWEAARAESHVQAAIADFIIEDAHRRAAAANPQLAIADTGMTGLNHGASASQLRRAVMDLNPDHHPSEAVPALSYWRAHAWVGQFFAPLNPAQRTRPHPVPPPPAQLAHLHAFVASSTQASDRIAIPTDATATRSFIALLSSGLPAAVRTGLALAWSHHRPFFDDHTTVVARIMVRSHLTECGYDPSGVWLWVKAWQEDPSVCRELMERIDWSELATAQPWVEHWVNLLIEGVQRSHRMIRYLQAATAPPDDF